MRDITRRLLAIYTIRLVGASYVAGSAIGAGMAGQWVACYVLTAVTGLLAWAAVRARREWRDRLDWEREKAAMPAEVRDLLDSIAAWKLDQDGR